MVDGEGYEENESTGMSVRRTEREEQRRRTGEPSSDEANPSGEGTVSAQNLRQSLAGSTGQGGALDLEVQKAAEAEETR